MSLFRYDPPAGSPPIEGFVRAYGDGPVVCRTCGCRLQPPMTWGEADGETTQTWRHFEGLPGHDARGCRVACVDEAHGRDGFVTI